MTKVALKSILYVVLMTLCFTQNSFAAPFEVGAFHIPPYYELENDTTVTGGYFIDTLKKIFDRAGIEYVFKGYPLTRLYKNLGDGTTQIFMGTTGVAEYEGKTIVSPKQITKIQLDVYTTGPASSLPKTADDLKGKSLITIFGYNYGGLIRFLEDPKNNITIETAKTHDLAFKMLQMGRASFLINYKEPAVEVLSKTKIPNIKKSTIKTLGIYIHVSKKVPNAQAVMDKLMKAYNELKAEGKIK